MGGLGGEAVDRSTLRRRGRVERGRRQHLLRQAGGQGRGLQARRRGWQGGSRDCSMEGAMRERDGGHRESYPRPPRHVSFQANPADSRGGGRQARAQQGGDAAQGEACGGGQDDTREDHSAKQIPARILRRCVQETRGGPKPRRSLRRYRALAQARGEVGTLQRVRARPEHNTPVGRPVARERRRTVPSPPFADASPVPERPGRSGGKAHLQTLRHAMAPG